MVAVLMSCGMISAFAQSVIQTSGALVIVPAFGEVRYPNDEAHVTLMIEEQDKDKAAAASRVNQKMKQGIDIIKREDPRAMLQTRGYYTYPVYAEDEAARPAGKIPQPAGWRVGHYLELTTTNISGLPNVVASAQRVLALNGLYFGLSDAAAKKLEEQRIAAAYKNLTDRIAAVAKSMGRNLSDVVLDTVDFEASGAYAQQQEMRAAKTMMAAAASPERIEDPSFEPGETTLSMRVVGKIRFK